LSIFDSGLFDMPDPLSWSAAIVGFVEFALEVAKATAEFVRAYKDCPREFKQLWLATHEFEIQVQRLAPTLEKVEEQYGPAGSLL
jgi:hypothetical protein